VAPHARAPPRHPREQATTPAGGPAAAGAGASGDLSSQYEIREQIGKGSFGSAFLVVHRPSRRQYVLKRVRLAKQTNWQRHSTFQEADLVAKLAHPFIVPHVASWITQGHTVNIVRARARARRWGRGRGAPAAEGGHAAWPRLTVAPTPPHPTPPHPTSTPRMRRCTATARRATSAR
jgi:hypothetical protein